MGNNCMKRKLSTSKALKKDASGFQAKLRLNQSSIEHLDISPSLSETEDASTQTELESTKINSAIILDILSKDTFCFHQASNTNDLETQYPISESKRPKRQNAFRFEKKKTNILPGRLCDTATQTFQHIQSSSFIVSSDMSCNAVHEFQTLAERASEIELLNDWNLQLLKSERIQILQAPSPIPLSNNWNEKQENLKRKDEHEIVSDNTWHQAVKKDVEKNPKCQRSEVSMTYNNGKNGFQELSCCGDFESNRNRVEISQKFWLTCERIQVNKYEEVIDDA